MSGFGNLVIGRDVEKLNSMRRKRKVVIFLIISLTDY